MSTRRLAVLLPTIAVLAIAPVAHAETLDLDALFNTAQVGIATRHVQSAREAPANVEVITDTEIRERGYTTVAEALRALPGFYIVNDELLPSVGVRGISSGERGWSRILKLMIDGQPVPYRPDGSNWLGPELIPIGLVKRIEVIRGPASALYGADAFLGVVNVVTKRGADIDGLRLDAMAGTRAGHPIERGQLDLATLPDTHGLDLTFGALAGLTDNSGLPLPGTSPNQATLAKNGQTVSARDFDYPASAFARLGFTPHPGLDVSFDTNYQHLDSGGEFQDWAPLTHQNRISEQNWYARTQASQTLNAAMSLDGSLAYSRGGPAGGDLLSVGRTDYNIERLLLAQGWDATGAFNWALGDRSGVTFGADWDRTMQNLPTYLQVFPNGATQPDGPPGGYAQLDNVGAYAQGIYYPMDDLGVTANLRDDQNSVYGNNLSSRLGLVYQVNAAITAKALYGSSFKAPSAPELYGTPLIYGDIVGNPDLKPERANTLEGLVTFSPSSTVDWTSDIYYTHVADKVTFLLQNGNPVAVNLGQLDSAGIESGVDWRWAFLDGFFNTSLQKTVQTTSDGFADPNGEIEPYPYWMANAGIGSPIWHLPLGTFLEARYVGWVPSSQSNFVANGHEAYEIPPAFVVDWTVTSRDLYWNADKETIVSFKIANLFDAQYTQPGYGGVDYPGLGRTFWLDFSQGF